MKKYVCIHGHFYQPPRENPWLEEVELQDSAHPFHDWNERITAQCYEPNSAARVLDASGRIERVVDNYSRMSFNFGPTLLSWLARARPTVHEAIVEADRQGAKRYQGHGTAIAQVYNHQIMPLANERDKKTQVVWGIEDFRARFGRDPEGMWLPETAADTASLETLAEHGIAYTILAPRQAARVREESGQWRHVLESSIDPTRPYRCVLPSGREITLFFYDGPISQDLAFGGLLTSGQAFRDRLFTAFGEGSDHSPLVHIATDGETYGHHQHRGDMALAYCFQLIEESEEVALTNYGAYLAEHPPTMDVEIFDNSSWSCIHGVERWREDCGCNSGMQGEWTQAWRAPLRRAMNWLGERCAEILDEHGPAVFSDPWTARDRYVEVLLSEQDEQVDRWLAAHAPGADPVAALKLMEMQRFAQFIFTSCGWFFDEISGIETVQILQYALRAMQLAEDIAGRPLQSDFASILAEAPSNVLASGAEVFEHHVKPAQVDLNRMGAHFALSSLFEEYPETFEVGCYAMTTELYNRRDAGRTALATGTAHIMRTTTRESGRVVFAAFSPGDHNLACGVSRFESMHEFENMEREVAEPFERGDTNEALRSLDNHFARNIYSVWHLFRDEQRKVMREVLAPAIEVSEAAYRQIVDLNYPVLNYLHWLNMPLPPNFLDATKFVVNTDLRRLLRQDEVDPDKLAELAEQAAKWNLKLDRDILAYLSTKWLSKNIDRLASTPKDSGLLTNVTLVLERLLSMGITPNLWHTQNVILSLNTTCERAHRIWGDEDGDAGKTFRKLADLLKVRI